MSYAREAKTSGPAVRLAKLARKRSLTSPRRIERKYDLDPAAAVAFSQQISPSTRKLPSPLLQAHFPHLLQNSGSRGRSPNDDSFGTQSVMIPKARRKSVSPARYFCSMAPDVPASGGVPEFDDTKPAVAIVDAQERDPGHADIGIDSAGKGVSLDPVILNGGQVPGNDGFGNGGIGGGAIDDRHLGFQADESDMEWSPR